MKAQLRVTVYRLFFGCDSHGRTCGLNFEMSEAPFHIPLAGPSHPRSRLGLSSFAQAAGNPALATVTVTVTAAAAQALRLGEPGSPTLRA